MRKIKVNLRTKVGICILTYTNADVMCYVMHGHLANGVERRSPN